MKCIYISLPKYFSVNNAGFVLGLDRVGSINDEEIEAMFSTNVFGLISMTQLLVKGKYLLTLHQQFPLRRSGRLQGTQDRAHH